MTKNVDGLATWDPATVVKHKKVGFYAPRTDLRPEEGCFVSLAQPTDDQPRGFIKVYPDGTAAYWREEGQQGKAAGSFDEAQDKNFAITGTANIALAPAVGSGNATVR